MTAVIRAIDLHYTYPDRTTALRGVSLTDEAGSRVALLGPNGAGKSTLLLNLAGLYLPSDGALEVLGRPLTRETAPGCAPRWGSCSRTPTTRCSRRPSGRMWPLGR